jgi:hypothetical protein
MRGKTLRGGRRRHEVENESHKAYKLVIEASRHP